ncbi:MAG: imidazole glycerol phosphate synthase subunit HisH [Candidatus Omnitrophota bacterium]
MVTIIDMGLGNVNSVHRALKHLNVPNRVSADVADIEQASKLIFPGVGNFFEVSKRLFATGMVDVIREQVLVKKKPLLGICLGMQLLASYGEEGGESRGLDLIKARVKRLKSEGLGLRLPHVGWNDVSSPMPLFSNIESNACFYFVHSYAMVLEERVESAACYYGEDFICAVKKGNVVGVQFHPEKSQGPGIQLLKNFLDGAC